MNLVFIHLHQAQYWVLKCDEALSTRTILDMTMTPDFTLHYIDVAIVMRGQWASVMYGDVLWLDVGDIIPSLMIQREYLHNSPIHDPEDKFHKFALSCEKK